MQNLHPKKRQPVNPQGEQRERAPLAQAQNPEPQPWRRTEPRPISLSGLRGFEAAARHLSFTLAAEELHLTQSSISRQVQGLEQDIGRPLFVRKTRELALTAAGQKLSKVVRQLLSELDKTVNDVRGVAHRRRVSVTTYASAASLWLLPYLPGFSRQHPDVDIRIDATDVFVDLQAEGIDVALRYCTDAQAPRGAIRLMDEWLAPALSPALLERIGPLSTPADLERATLLVIDDRLPHSYENTWEKWFAFAGSEPSTRAGRLVFNYIDQSMQAAVRGQGVVLAKFPLADDLLSRGELVLPFSLRMPSRYGYWLVLNPLTAQHEHVQAFADWLVATSRPQAPR